MSNQYQCRKCGHPPYKQLPRAFTHLRAKHGLTMRAIRAGMDNLWTHWLKNLGDKP